MAAALLLSAAVLVWSATTASAQGGGDVVINELVARNSSGLTDSFDETSDWIELHNTTGAVIDLSGWVILADDTPWLVPDDTEISANGHLVVFASGRNLVTAGGERHTNFKLSGSGEYLGLIDPTGVTVSEYAASYPPQVSDQSYGIAPSGQNSFFAVPTPGAANGTPTAGPVTFSVEHGFYDSAFPLALTAAPGAEIRYTLDGSEPTPSYGTVYNGPFTINQTTAVRAIAYGGGNDPSFSTTHTYLFLDDVITQSSTPSLFPTSPINGQVFDWGMDPDIVNGNEAAVRASLTEIPTLSLVTDVDNLFDATDGIYVNAQESGIDWERAASIELIDPSGVEDGFTTNAGIRMRGGFSRSDRNPKHSWRLFFRSDYGDAKLDYPLFGDEGADEFDKIDLRTAQNYSWAWGSSLENSMVRELWSRDSQGEMGQPYTRSRHHHLYVNGQYMGIFQTHERAAEDYAESYLGGDQDDYDVVKNERSLGGRTAATSGSDADWFALFDLVEDVTITDAEFDIIRDQVDLENLADYYVLHFFSGDNDGAVSFFRAYRNGNNWKAIRNRNGGKWLFFDHDSEHSLCVSRSAADVDNTPNVWLLGAADNVQWLEEWMNPGWLHAALLTNDEYVQIFRDSVQEHMINADGALQVAAAQQRLDARVGDFGGAVLAHSARWGDRTDVDNPRTVADWQAQIDLIRDTCFATRYSTVTAQFQAAGLLPTVQPPSLNTFAGAVSYGSTVQITNPNVGGTVWYTMDGTDPLGANLAPSPSAQSGNAAVITDYSTVTARVQAADGFWSSSVSTDYELFNLPSAPAVVLNEYNAVGSGDLLGNNASDPTFGRQYGNGGDWFEMVVVEDGLDIRGWQFELYDSDGGPLEARDRFVVTNAAALSNLPSGTIITVAEDVADDVTVDPQSLDFWINLQANEAGDGAYITAASQENFDTNKDDWQLVVRDVSGTIRALRTGEGTGTFSGVGPSEVGKLEESPSVATTPRSNYDDGTTSTFGLPNRWDAFEQDLSQLQDVPPVIAAVIDQFANAGSAAGLTLSATNDGPVTWSATGLPAGTSINPSTGRITGTITGPQLSTVTVTATDAASLFGTVTFDWEVNTAPSIGAIADRTSGLNVATSQAIQVSDVDGDTVSATVSGLPTGLSFDAPSGIISGFPSAAGVFTITVTATDEHNLDAVETFVWSIDGGQPTAGTSVRCIGGNGVIDIDLVNPEFSAVNFSITVDGLPTRTIAVAAFSAGETFFSGRPDGLYQVVIEAQGGTVFTGAEQVACDEALTVSVSCLSGNGRVDAALINQSATAATYEVSVGALAPRTITLAAFETGQVTITGRPDGFLPLTVTRNGLNIYDDEALVDCDSEPETTITTRCFAGAGRIDVRFVNDSLVTHQYEMEVTGLAPRDLTLDAQESGTVSRTGRPDGLYIVIVRRDGVQLDARTELVNCRIAPEVEVTVSCLGANGRVDVALDNDTSVVRSYEVTVGALAAQTATLSAQEATTLSRTGRPDGTYTVTVSRNGTLLTTETVTVSCDPVSGPASISQSCLAGHGRVDVALFNDTGASAVFDVTFGLFAPRTRTLAAGESRTETITGRPDGPFDVVVDRDGTPLASQTLSISCS